MIALAGPLHLFALVLVASGIGKLVDPWPATVAMRDARLPVPFRGRAVAGAALGVTEIVVGLLGLAAPHWWAAAAVAGVYGGFAAFILRLRASDADAGCGCFGASSTPPGATHLVVVAAAAALSLVVAATGVPDIVDVLGDGVGVAVPYVALLAVGAAMVLVGPSLSAERSTAGAGPRPFAPTRPPAPRRVP